MRASIQCSTAAALVLACAPAGAATVVRLDSDAGDYVGQGRSQTFQAPDWTLGAQPTFDNGVSVSIEGDAFWTLTFAPPQNEILAPGTYAGATRFPFQSPTRPGLSASGDGRGCNESSGHFEVIEASFGPGGEVEAFAADFEQHCEHALPALRGAVRINSSVPLQRTGPHAIAGVDVESIEGGTVQLSAAGSRDRGGLPITAYRWRQVAGARVRILRAGAALAHFVAPPVRPEGDLLEFELTVTNSLGETDTDRVRVRERSKSGPLTYFFMDSQDGDYIGQGITWHYTQAEGNFRFTRNFDAGVSMGFDGETPWTAEFAHPQQVELVPGAYDGATRFPFQAAGVPGLSVSGDGRGCNTLTGRFDVLQVEYGAAGVERFAADFEQHCEGHTAALSGEVRFNYLDPSIPRADAGLTRGARPGANVRLDGSASRDPGAGGRIAAYEWRQLGGPPVSLRDADTATPRFTAPVTGAARETLVFELMVTDGEGFRDLDQVIVRVR